MHGFNTHFSIFKITELFLIFNFNLKNEKPNLLKQTPYESIYHLLLQWISIKESNIFNDQTFKLPVRTQGNKH